MMPGMASGSVTRRKHRGERSAEIARRLQHRRVDPLQRDIERQDHQRQVRVDDSDPDPDRRE